MTTPRRRSGRGRLGRRLVGLVLLIVLLELSLQVLAPIVQHAMARKDPPISPQSELVILCVGDSNTYGLNVPRAVAWPARLAGLLAPRYDAPVAVVNRGVPGSNSAQVAAGLEHDLPELEPDLVLIQVGVNDTWNTADEEPGWSGWLSRLRLIRLVSVLTSGVTTARPFAVRSDNRGEFLIERGDDVQPVRAFASDEDGGLTRTGQRLADNLDRWLGRALDACAESGARAVLVTYPEFQGRHGEVNGLLRALAARRQVPLIDLEATFAGHYAAESYAALMFNDSHLNVRGYERAAADILAALDAAGLLAPPRDASPPIPRVVSVPPAVQARGDGRLELTGPPGWAFQVLVGRADFGGFLAGGVTVPLAADEILDASRLLPELSGWLDGSGSASIEISPVLDQRAGGAPLSACLLLLNEPGGTDTDPVAAISPLVIVRF